MFSFLERLFTRRKVKPQISSGQNHVIFLLKKDSVYGYGWCNYGCLGNGKYALFEIEEQPIKIAKKLKVKQVACGSGHSVFLTSENEVYACGNGYNGQLGTGGKEMMTIPVKINFEHRIKEVVCGGCSTFFLTIDGRAYGCGSDVGEGKDSLLPILVPTIFNIRQIACGLNHSIFLLNNGEVYVRGWCEGGRLGNGKIHFMESESSPWLLTNLPKIKQVACGAEHTMFLTETGDVLACGKFNHSPTPILMLEGKDIKKIACGQEHAIFLTKERRIYACGTGSDGQLCTDDRRVKSVPFLVENLHGIMDVFCGNFHTFLVNEHRKIKMCGRLCEDTCLIPHELSF